MSIKFACPGCGKRLSAPEGASGKTAKCPGCQLAVTVPEPESEVLDAEEIGQGGLVEKDWEPPLEDSPWGRENLRNEIPCPMCKELINSTARKCRFCGEYLSGGRSDRKAGRRNSTADSDLDTAEWLLCVLCSGIACIFAIVYLIQGKPKGAKMLLVSILMIIFWNFVNAMVSVALNAR